MKTAWRLLLCSGLQPLSSGVWGNTPDATFRVVRTVKPPRRHTGRAPDVSYHGHKPPKRSKPVVSEVLRIRRLLQDMPHPKRPGNPQADKDVYQSNPAADAAPSQRCRSEYQCEVLALLVVGLEFHHPPRAEDGNEHTPTTPSSCTSTLEPRTRTRSWEWPIETPSASRRGRTLPQATVVLRSRSLGTNANTYDVCDVHAAGDLR
ncbi:hypothetical protein B0T16DRAFT_385772 [Cercophora newfieldiana]|uniref:Secreted protein n=1 Tax=Cercophora newfieldiana TaxID=92897 RepID=A0AA40D1W1_9PEZI|nr:hypothetical protein B0T16DRAFT_385772 [Cercophora newfieldiana]